MERALRREVAGFGDLLSEATTIMRRLRDLPAPEGVDLSEWSELSRSLADFAERPRTGPAGRSEQSYAALSALYVRVIDEGEQRPIRALAERLGLAEKTVQNHLFKARERGLLTSLGRGKAGGVLTDKAKEILNGHHQAP
jgi:DNA-binding transcriptional ArsR family regulator